MRGNFMHSTSWVRNVIAASMLLATSAAFAWTPPAVGKACSALRGDGPPASAIAGNYLGGRALPDGRIDWKSFQGCFATSFACQSWLTHHAQHFPLQPGFARCIVVTLR